MTTADEYQRFAEECMSWARCAKTDAERKAFLDMARAWTIASAKASDGVVRVDPPSSNETSEAAPQ